MLCAWAIANFLGKFTQVLEVYTPPIIMFLALVMATIVGIVSGIYPAVLRLVRAGDRPVNGTRRRAASRATGYYTVNLLSLGRCPLCRVWG